MANNTFPNTKKLSNAEERGLSTLKENAELEPNKYYIPAIKAGEENYIVPVTDFGKGSGSGHVTIIDTDFTGYSVINESGIVVKKAHGIGGNGLTQTVMLFKDGDTGKQVVDLYPSSDYTEDINGNARNSDEYVEWFDGVYPSNSTYPQIPKAVNMENASVLDIYTWSIFQRMVSSTNPDIPSNPKNYLNPKGINRVHYTVTEEGRSFFVNSKIGSPLAILADSLVDDKVYEIRVHLMKYSSSPDWGNPVINLNGSFRCHEDVETQNTIVNVFFDTYIFSDEDSNRITGEPLNPSFKFVRTKTDSSTNTSPLTIVRWIMPPIADPSSYSTGSSNMELYYNYNLVNARRYPNCIFAEQGLARGIFVKHGDFIYVMTY